MSGRYEVEFKRSAKKSLDRLEGPIRAPALRKVAAWQMMPGHLAPLGRLVLMICNAFGSGTTA